jgi:ubiquinone/menaquinone biosynthesis C-methylase UbiE
VHNEEQINYWNGEAGQRWAAEDERMARLLSPVTLALLDHLQPQAGSQALDIGCGGGSQSLLLAQRLGDRGHVLGVDISAPLLEVANAKLQESRPTSAAIDFLQADAAVHGFEPASVDLLFSRFGVMFFDDPVAAFRNIHGALRETGRVGFCCWRSLRDNAWAWEPLQAALRHIAPPEPADPHAPGPFALADPERCRDILQQAGFTDISMEPFSTEMVFGEAAGLRQNVEDLARIGPISRLLAEQNADTLARVLDAIAESLAPYYDNDALRLPGSVWFVTAAHG